MNWEKSIETEWIKNLDDDTYKIAENTKWEDIPAIKTLKTIAEKWENEKPDTYIFPGDEEAIGKYNESINGNEDYELQLHLPPHPFAGNPYAPIWVINLNPGYNPGDEIDFTGGEGFEYSIKQLMGEVDCNYFLRLPDHGNGACNWWKKYLLSQNICDDDIELADKFFSLDYFPYQSKKYKDPGKDFESTKLFKKIIEWGIKRKVLFLIMRNKKKIDSMLKDEIEKKNINIMYAASQASWISLGNLCTPEQYCRIKREKEKNMEENQQIIEQFLKR